MEAKAKFKYVRGTPRKFRLIVDQVRGKRVVDALNILKFEKKAGASDVSKLISSAVSNADQIGGGRADNLYVKSITVDQATIMKRWMPRARGSASAIQKKLSHLSVVLAEQL